MKVLMATMKMDIGGAETHILEIARELKRRGVDITVVSGGGVFVQKLEDAGVRHVYAPLQSKSPACLLASVRILSRLLKEEKFDIIHAHARIPAAILSPLAKHRHIRFVTTAHLNFDVNFIWRLFTKWGERSLAVSDDIKKYLIDEYGVYPDNVGVTINGIDTDAYHKDIDASAQLSELGLAPNPRRIVHVSRIDSDRSEAAVQLASIAPRLHERFPECDILIVGDGNDFARLKAAAEKANRACGSEVVKLAGARTDIPQMIGCGGIFVGVSRAAYEAMAMERPLVLAGNQGYLGIYTEDKFPMAYAGNFCCRGCGDTTPEALLRDLCALLSMEKDKLDALGRLGRQTILEHYSVKRMGDDYMEMYEKVAPYRYQKHGNTVLCGYYGFGNIGDEALLAATVKRLRTEDPDCRMTALTASPSRTARRSGVRCIYRYNLFGIIREFCHMKGEGTLVLGGGSLIQNMTSSLSLSYYSFIIRLAKRFGLRVRFLSSGIGPFRSGRGREKARKALEAADVIELRDRESMVHLEKLGIDRGKVRVTADCALLIEPADRSWVDLLLDGAGIAPDEKFVCVSLRGFKGVQTDRFADAFGDACGRVREKYGFRILFLPMQESADRSVCDRAAKRCGGTVLRGLSCSDALGVISRAELVIGMRLHSLIFAAMSGVPFISLSYDTKVRVFSSSFEGLPEGMFFDAVKGAPSEEKLLAAVRTACENRQQISELLLSETERMKKRLM